MKKALIKLLYGILIGISCLIPGFSGGTMALILGIYEEFTGAISLITKDFIKAVKELWSLGIGMVLGAIIAVMTVVKCLDKWPLITSGFFVGLVIATIPLTIKNINKRKLKIFDWITLFLCGGISLFLCFADKFGLLINLSNPNVGVVILVFIVAAVAAAMMIVPAASGALILLAFGMFEPVVTILKDSANGALNGDFSILVNNLIILIPFILGAILGVLLIAKAISYLLKNHDLIIWSGILGLLFTSVFTIYYNAFHDPLDPLNTTRLDNIMNNLTFNIIGTIVFLLIGFFGLRLLMKAAEKKKIE